MNKYKDSFIIILGFVLSILYVWNRIFRIRLPKELPINLSTYYFFILLLLIIFHIFIIIKIIMILDTKIKMDLLYQPFKALFQFLIFQKEKTYNKLIKFIYDKGEIKINQSKNFYLIVLMIKLIIALILFFEVLLLGRIKWFYISLVFLIIPMIYRIFIYILKDFLEKQCNHLDNQVAIQWNNPPSGSLESWEDHKLISTAFYIKGSYRFNVDYSLFLDYTQELSKNYPQKNIDFEKLLENKIDYINIHLRKIQNIISIFSNEMSSPLSKIIQIIISSLYIISWIYVLYVSIDSLDINEILNLFNILSAREENNEI